MARPTTTASGEAKVRASVRLDPELKAWAKAQGINLSEALAAKLIELRSPQSAPPSLPAAPPQSPQADAGEPNEKDVPF